MDWDPSWLDFPDDLCIQLDCLPEVLSDAGFDHNDTGHFSLGGERVPRYAMSPRVNGANGFRFDVVELYDGNLRRKKQLLMHTVSPLSSFPTATMGTCECGAHDIIARLASALRKEKILFMTCDAEIGLVEIIASCFDIPDDVLVAFIEHPYSRGNTRDLPGLHISGSVRAGWLGFLTCEPGAFHIHAKLPESSLAKLENAIWSGAIMRCIPACMKEEILGYLHGQMALGYVPMEYVPGACFDRFRGHGFDPVSKIQYESGIYMSAQEVTFAEVIDALELDDAVQMERISTAFRESRKALEECKEDQKIWTLLAGNGNAPHMIYPNDPCDLDAVSREVAEAFDKMDEMGFSAIKSAMASGVPLDDLFIRA
jgi:hypothetical protein